jgi:hypothetical protein
MTRSPADPMGYYAVLGVGPLADADEIKAAYRQKAKILHPDLNPFDEARREFLAVVDAYQTLRDPESRRRYDAGGLQPGPAGLIDPYDPSPEPLTCSRCGKVSAQPRYILFHRVKSSPWSVRRQAVRGIFCRDCADRTAIRVSTLTWLQGWWSLTGPLHTVRALLTNLKGGEMPLADNLWVLLHQARAFLARGDHLVAHALAEQAKAFAKSDAERRSIADIVRAAGSRIAPRLKNRRLPWSYAPIIQALPLLALAVGSAVAIAAVALRGQTDLVGAAITIHPAQAGETRHVAVEILKVRQGPAATEPTVALLDRFTTVQVMDSTPDGEWARILTPSGITGYVPSRFLFGGAGDEPKNRWCAEQKGPPLDDGDVLLRRSGGEHRLAVRNSTGQDVVVRLKTQNNQTLLAFFARAGSAITVNDIPDGTFRAVFATGQDYSRACGVFLKDMQTFIVPIAQLFQASSQTARRQALSLDIPAVGDGPAQSHPLPLESFLDN